MDSVAVLLDEDPEPREPTFYLYKHKDLNGLKLPLKGSQRVKYTCLDVSNNYIALGTNAGGIHIFHRSSLRHYRFLNAKVFSQMESSRALVDIGVIIVQFSNNENFLAAALSSGNVVVWTLNFDKREATQVAKKSDAHKSSTVTNLCWNAASTKLFIGDNKGCVTGLEVSTGKQIRQWCNVTSGWWINENNKGNKIRNFHTIVKEGPAIVQLDFADEKLLLSNTKRCTIYMTSKENLMQIGTKGRDGLFGACFVHRQGNDFAVIYCARPGARLWEVDGSGHVLSTQQYKKLLATPSIPIVGNVCGIEKIVADKSPTYNFPKLLVMRDHFLLTWTRETITIVNPVTGNLVLWNNQFDDIEDVSCRRQEIYIFHTGGRVTRYSLIPPKECAAKLFVAGDWLQCSKVLISCKSQIIPLNARDHIPTYVVRRVREILQDDLQHEELVNELDKLERSLESASNDTTTGDDSEYPKCLMVAESDTYSVTSDVFSNPDSESTFNMALDSGVEDIEDTPKSEKKEKLKRLKHMFQGQLKDLSLDTMLLAGVQAASHLNWSNHLAFSPTPNMPGSSYRNSSTFTDESPGYEKPSSPSESSLSGSRSVGSWDDGESDSEERKDEVLFKDKKKKKRKVHTVDLVSPLQPTDLIKLEKSRAPGREDMDKMSDPATEFNDRDIDESNERSAEVTSGLSNSGVTSEGLRSRSVAAKQEVVEKARKLLKRLAPDERVPGNENTRVNGSKGVGAKGTGTKGGSTCIHSPLEVKSLVIISRETRKKVRDSRILYDPKSLRSTLLEWIIYLEKANVAISRVYPKNKDTREYYVTDVGKVLTPSIKGDLTRFLDAEDTATVSNLVTMCFKMKMYSSANSETEKETDVKQDEIANEPLLKCHTCQRRLKRCFFDSVLPKVSRSVPSSMELREDLERSRFLGVNFQQLDYQSLKANIIANCRDHRHLLKILLNCLDDFTERDAVDDAIDIGDTKVALQLMRDKAENYQRRLLRHVFRLYYLVPRDVARLCAEIYPYFHPWEVVVVCLSSSANLLSNCSDFLIYVTHLIQRNTNKNKNSLDLLDDIYHSKDFLILVFHSALILDDLADSDVRCPCGWPRPNSHQTSFQYEELMIEIANHFKISCDRESLEELLKISWNHGYWQGCIQLLVMLGLRTEALQLVLQLGDITLMNTKQLWGPLPQSANEWKYVLEFLARFSLNQEKPEEGSDFDDKANELKKPDETQTIVFNSMTSDVSEHEEFGRRERNELVHKCTAESEGETNEEISFSCELITENDKEQEHSYKHTCIRNAITGQRSQCIDIKSFSLVLLQKVGPKQTLEIISKARLEHVPFTHEFYYKCVLSSLLENHQRCLSKNAGNECLQLHGVNMKQHKRVQSALCHRILREVNQHMWSSKCTTMSPQIYQMKEVETIRGGKEDIFKGKEPLRYRRSLEDGACNWGIDVPLPGATCGSCPLPLCEKLPGHNQGVIIFPCGHVFHKECSAENYCLTCVQDRLEIPFIDAGLQASGSSSFNSV